MDARRFVPLSAVALLILFATCDKAPVIPNDLRIEQSVQAPTADADSSPGIVVNGLDTRFLATSSLLGSSGPCVAPPSNMVSWWPGDGSGEDIAGTNHGDLLGGVAFETGFVTSGGGQAFSFGGVSGDAMVRVANSADLNPTATSGFTVDAWVKSNIEVLNGTIAGKGNPWQEQFILDQHWGVWRGVIRQANNWDVRIHSPMQTGVFTHLALTWNGATLRLYVNGTLVGSAPASSIRTSDVFLGIGLRSEAGYRDEELQLEFDGIIDEVEFYGRALSSGEVAAIYNAERAGKCKAIAVLIDIQPNDETNSLNCEQTNNNIAVAILTTEDFDATTVDHTTVTFEGAVEAHEVKRTGELQRHEMDVDEDGDIDLLLHFLQEETTLTCESTEGELEGRTFDGAWISGTDAVSMNAGKGDGEGKNRRADLSITKADQADPVTVGNNIVYAIDVINNGPDAADGITVTDPVPEGTTFISADINPGSCGEAAGVVTCNLALLPSGVGQTITLTLRADQIGQVTNTATVNAAKGVKDPDKSNNSASETTTVN